MLESYEAPPLNYRRQESKTKIENKTTYQEVAGTQSLVSKSKGVQLSHCLEDHLQDALVILFIFWVLQVFFKVFLPEREAQVHVAFFLLKLEELQ